MLTHNGHRGTPLMADRSRRPSFGRAPGFFLLLVILTVFPGGCARPLTVPIETARLYSSEQAHPVLLVYLPGNGDAADSLKRHGLVSLLHDRNISADILGVNAHLGYYQNGSIIERLKQDVIDPAKKRGYDRIWLVGNSLGAYGSLIYAARYPADISGVVLLGAYAGERGIIREIERAGGLRTWDPGTIETKDWDRQLWSWLKQYESRNRSYPPLYLGYGRWDRFTYAQDFLATLLPGDRVVVVPGGHDWPTWKKAWGLLLDRMASSLK